MIFYVDFVCIFSLSKLLNNIYIHVYVQTYIKIYYKQGKSLCTNEVS